MHSFKGIFSSNTFFRKIHWNDNQNSKTEKGRHGEGNQGGKTKINYLKEKSIKLKKNYLRLNKTKNKEIRNTPHLLLYLQNYKL